jgi:hypothetical protein
LQHLQDSLIIQDGFTIEQRQYGDCEFSFDGRAPHGVPEVQIWSGIKCRDRDSRYVFALRGGNNDDLYLARYGADGAARFLGIAPLHFHPIPGDWYTLRAVTRGNRILIFLNQERTPRINVVDDEAPWAEGGVSLGGGWLPAEFRGVKANTLSAEDASAVDALGDGVWKTPKADKNQLRAQQRGAYLPAELPALDQPRITCPLDGSWLFLPDQELGSSVTPQSEVLDDGQWHVMDVPNFWTPTLSWLHGETGFPKLKGISTSKGICDKFYEAEMNRLDGYTFDWRTTKGGWYRHHLNLPAAIANRRFELCFDAVAKVADVWLNGIHVGSHVGMFGEVRCDITHAVKPGRNLLAVHVVGHLGDHAARNEVLGVAVTVEVTSDMLSSLPHGMYPNDASGIWQPVTLLVTNEVCVQDVYTRPRLNGLDFDVTILNAASGTRDVSVSYRITSSADGAELRLKHPIAILTSKNSVQLAALPIAGREITSLQEAGPEEVVIVPNAEVRLGNSKVDDELRRFVSSGGRVLLLHAGAKLPSLFPDQVKAFRTCPGEIVSMHIPESPAFDGLEPLDLAWFELGAGRLPQACRGTYQIESQRADTSMLAEVVDIHGYLKTPADLAKYSGTPLVQLDSGKGRLIASEMMLLEAPQDPVAGRLLANLIKTLGSDS